MCFDLVEFNGTSAYGFNMSLLIACVRDGFFVAVVIVNRGWFFYSVDTLYSALVYSSAGFCRFARDL